MPASDIVVAMITSSGIRPPDHTTASPTTPIPGMASQPRPSNSVATPAPANTAHRPAAAPDCPYLCVQSADSAPYPPVLRCRSTLLRTRQRAPRLPKMAGPEQGIAPQRPTSASIVACPADTPKAPGAIPTALRRCRRNTGEHQPAKGFVRPPCRTKHAPTDSPPGGIR